MSNIIGLGLRGAQILFGLIVIGLAGHELDTWGWALGHKIESALGLAVASGTLTLIFATLLLLGSLAILPIPNIRYLPWVYVAVDAFLLILWLATTAAVGERIGTFEWWTGDASEDVDIIRAAWVFSFFELLLYLATTALGVLGALHGGAAAEDPSPGVDLETGHKTTTTDQPVAV